MAVHTSRPADCHHMPVRRRLASNDLDSSSERPKFYFKRLFRWTMAETVLHESARNGGAAERLLEVASRLFAEQGFDSTSTRALTRAARVNLAAIAYHFESKEGLYQAVIQRLIDDTEPFRRALIDDLRAGIAAAADDRRRLADVALSFVRRLLAMQLGEDFPRQRFQLMLREVMQPSFAFERVLSGHIAPLQDALCELVASAHGADPGDERVKILAHAITGQCLMFGIGRPVVLARLDWGELTGPRIKLIVNTVGASVLAALGLPPVGAPATEP